ncbi:S26 family signal peptidase [Haloplanus rubicundus]|uniref:S26 family signal peptidase n=1 Tax=Haloplanus rubicundus TaxID=1547898 RepID=A0A345E025_9EURY|nr:S26 family signal peptidase [Haloplanus rubicundus]AXG05547.1 S26 family signal peptidase [Haloplanus rubicundus]
MSADDGPRPPDGHGPEGGDGGATGPLRRVLTATDGPLLVVRETALSVSAVVVIGLLLFAISGVWPPMVAVESGSMEPHMHKGDLVFITDTGRFAPDAAHGDTGIVPRDVARDTDYWKFGGYGSVIVYDDPGDAGPPVIHRAHFWVEEGENWYDRADPDYVSAADCGEMRNCPAPHAGFVTKGDANGGYDQVNGISEPVKPGWIVGTARVRIPYLGWVRLGVSGVVLDSTPGMIEKGTTPTVAEAVTPVESTGASAGAGATATEPTPIPDRTAALAGS